MSSGIRASVSRRLATLAAAAGLAVAAVLVAAAPAFAHDELLLSDPADGATVDTLPAEVTLAFSAFPLDEPGATLVEVTDATGTDLVSGDPVIDGTEVIQALEGPATGEITVVWKIVSSDGHPIAGEFSFTVTGDAATPAPTATGGAEPTTAVPDEAPDEATPGATPTAAPISAETGVSPAVVWTIAGVVLAALGAAIGYLLASRSRRRRRTQDLAQTRSDATESGDRRPDED